FEIFNHFFRQQAFCQLYVRVLFHCTNFLSAKVLTYFGKHRFFTMRPPFLHTRSFNILRRIGSGVKRKSSENQ
ncbi:hypothetical protein, partial [uncultured Duncaniella sp.]|uniref:hypothetical protein n=1 Tax=uncultured Duncaniella sp. TaxID=2768039 RepID=UPI00266D4255